MSKPNVRWISVDRTGTAVWKVKPHWSDHMSMYVYNPMNFQDMPAFTMTDKQGKEPALYRVRLERVK